MTSLQIDNQLHIENIEIDTAVNLGVYTLINDLESQINWMSRYRMVDYVNSSSSSSSSIESDRLRRQIFVKIAYEYANSFFYANNMVAEVLSSKENILALNNHFKSKDEEYKEKCSRYDVKYQAYDFENVPSEIKISVSSFTERCIDIALKAVTSSKAIVIDDQMEHSTMSNVIHTVLNTSSWRNKGETYDLDDSMFKKS